MILMVYYLYYPIVLCSYIWYVGLFGVLYPHQTFTECVSNQYTPFGVSIYQMWLQVMERLLILFRFFGHYAHNWVKFIKYLHQTTIPCVFDKNINILVWQNVRWSNRKTGYVGSIEMAILSFKNLKTFKSLNFYTIVTKLGIRICLVRLHIQ